jgi:hypothetical protein
MSTTAMITDRYANFSTVVGDHLKGHLPVKQLEMPIASLSNFLNQELKYLQSDVDEAKGAVGRVLRDHGNMITKLRTISSPSWLSIIKDMLNNLAIRNLKDDLEKANNCLMSLERGEGNLVIISTLVEKMGTRLGVLKKSDLHEGDHGDSSSNWKLMEMILETSQREIGEWRRSQHRPEIVKTDA